MHMYMYFHAYHVHKCLLYHVHKCLLFIVEIPLVKHERILNYYDITAALLGACYVYHCAIDYSCDLVD